MNVIKTTIPGLLILEPRVFKDSRGYFLESFSKRVFEELVGPVTFVQDNESRSVKGVVRGLHFQKPPYSQAKLVRCTRGRVLDVVVDIRKGSATFGKSFSAILSEENHLQIFIPKGFAHGFSVLSDVAVFQYLCDEYYHPEAEAGISALDPSLGIDWLIPEEEMIMSDKDRGRSCLTPEDAI
ncbi:MAG: dTDP-4-dehydrorhamnose 3,5-epimerase [Bacteroidales bacterium]|nr:dTDP-4-dehydrorhamnose 3,5-epimerase [Bacteroidales bacterium]